MAVEQATKSRVDPRPGHTRRKLIKRLALLAAAGYAAPKAVMIAEPWACDRPGKTAPHGGSTSGPFCV